MLSNNTDTELSSLEETRGEFNPRKSTIKLGIDLHQAFCVVVKQEGGALPQPAQRFSRSALLAWAAKLRRQHPRAAIHALYEACGFGFGLQRDLSALGIHCYVVCPQKLDERNQRVKTDGRDARALCLKLDRFVEGNRAALALVRVPRPAEEQRRAIHRQREQLVRTRKQLEAHGRSLLVNHGLEPVNQWWKARTFVQLTLPPWLRELLEHTQPLLLALEGQIRKLARELEEAAAPGQPRGLGALSSVVIDREIGDWQRFNGDGVLVIDRERRRDWVKGGDRPAYHDPVTWWAGERAELQADAAELHPGPDDRVLDDDRSARESGRKRIELRKRAEQRNASGASRRRRLLAPISCSWHFVLTRPRVMLSSS